MISRRFAFWVGFALFWVADAVRAAFLDDLAATIMDAVGTTSSQKKNDAATPVDSQKRVRWKVAENEKWEWFERFEQTNSEWERTGTTRPVSKETGDFLKTKRKRKFLEDTLVPLPLRLAQAKADPERRARDGRPPSKWLRRLNANEIRIWLKTIDVPEAGVAGMTFWTHLTRDHSFVAEKIKGLSIDEQAKLHAAAHFGY